MSTGTLVLSIKSRQAQLYYSTFIQPIRFSVLFSGSFVPVFTMQVKSGRVSVAMVGYANIIKGDNQAVTCATTGTHVLLENEKIAVTGTMLYDRSQGSLIPYLAAVGVTLLYV